MSFEAGRDTAAQVLAKLITVDGDGSGLDADSVDGLTNVGKVLQIVMVEDSTKRSTTAQIPVDNTIPQSDEGSAWASVSFTPVNSSSTIYITVSAQINNTDWYGVIAIFTSGSTNAEAAVLQNASDGVLTCACSLAGWSGARTISSRFGNSNAGFTTLLNQRSDTINFGAIPHSTLTIIEESP